MKQRQRDVRFGEAKAKPGEVRYGAAKAGRGVAQQRQRVAPRRRAKALRSEAEQSKGAVMFGIV